MRISLMFCGGWIFLLETFQCFPTCRLFPEKNNARNWGHQEPSPSQKLQTLKIPLISWSLKKKTYRSLYLVVLSFPEMAFSGMRSLEGKVNKRLSSMTLFMDSIQFASRSPSSKRLKRKGDETGWCCVVSPFFWGEEGSMGWNVSSIFFGGIDLIGMVGIRWKNQNGHCT